MWALLYCVQFFPESENREREPREREREGGRERERERERETVERLERLSLSRAALENLFSLDLSLHVLHHSLCLVSPPIRTAHTKTFTHNAHHTRPPKTGQAATVSSELDGLCRNASCALSGATRAKENKKTDTRTNWSRANNQFRRTGTMKPSVEGVVFLAALLLAPNSAAFTEPIQEALPLACSSETSSRAVLLVGQGHCIDSRNLTVNAYTCTANPCVPMQDLQTCELVCVGTRGCTGFELVNNSAGSDLSNNCRVFSSVVPDLGSGLWPWRVENGTQNGHGSGFAVVTSDGSTDACCYKVAYPIPNVNDNPVPTPPLQSDAQKAIFANRSSLAAAAAADALPALESLIDFCASYSPDGGATHLFDAASCPGMADVTRNGTLKPWPNASEILSRFSQEACGIPICDACSLCLAMQQLCSPLWFLCRWTCDWCLCSFVSLNMDTGITRSQPIQTYRTFSTHRTSFY